MYLPLSYYSFIIIINTHFFSVRIIQSPSMQWYRTALHPLANTSVCFSLCLNSIWTYCPQHPPNRHVFFTIGQVNSQAPKTTLWRPRKEWRTVCAITTVWKISPIWQQAFTPTHEHGHLEQVCLQTWSDSFVLSISQPLVWASTLQCSVIGYFTA